MLVRFFSSAVDPSDLGEVRRIFAEDIKPAFEAMPGCHSIELVVCNEKNAGGLLDTGAISRWSGQEALTTAVESRAVAESMVRILPFLQIEPVIKTFEILE